MEPLDFLTIFRQRWKIILAAVLISAGLAWFTTPESAKGGPPVVSYTASATLIQEPGGSVQLPYVALLATWPGAEGRGQGARLHRRPGDARLDRCRSRRTRSWAR